MKTASRIAALLLICGCALGAAFAAPPPAAAPAAEDAPKLVHLKLDEREYSLGRADAPLTMVEFTDYQCPYCREFQAKTFALIKKNYIDTGKVRFIVRDLPLEFHSSARPAAEAAHCAAEQGKFWEMHHALLSGDDPLANGGIDRRASQEGLDLERLHACTRAARYETAIARNAATADAIGIRGTPAFVIGQVSQGVLTGELAQGAFPYSEFDAALKDMLGTN